MAEMWKDLGMRWRYWSLLVSLSVLLHMALFWPSPNPIIRDALPPAFLVRISPSQSASEPLKLSRDALDAENETILVETAGVRRPVRDEQPRPPLTKRTLGEEALPAPNGIVPQDAPQAAQQRRPPDGAAPIPEGVAPELVGSDGAKGMSLARYRMALAAAAVRMQVLENDAMGAEGTAVVDVRLGGVGPKVYLAVSSGVERLDRRAVALLNRAIQAVPAPPTEGDAVEVSVRLPVVFALDDS